MSEASAETILSASDRTFLLDLARRSVDRWVRARDPFDWQSPLLSSSLRALGGCFVTIHAAGRLRGCIGSIAFVDPLAKSVRDNAISAAHRDPRFDPVHLTELHALSFEISALTQGDHPKTPFRKVVEIEEIQIGRDGICIERGRARGVLLPQVAAERNWSREQFLAATCVKAGLDQAAWREPATSISRFSAVVFGDVERSGN